MITEWLNYLGLNRRVSAGNAQAYEPPKDTVVAEEIIFHNGVRYSVVQRRTAEGRDYVEVKTIGKHGKNMANIHNVNGLEELVRSTGFKGELR